MEKRTKSIFKKFGQAGFIGQYILALIFISAGILKLWSVPGPLWITVFPAWPAGLTHAAGLILPWAEITLGLLLISGYFKNGVLAAALFFISIFIFSNVYSLISGNSASCNCLGSALSLTHAQSLTLDIVMLGMGIAAIFSKKRFPEIRARKTIRLRLWTAAGAVIMIAVMLLSAWPAATLNAGTLGSSRLSSIMHPTPQQLSAWEADYRNAPAYVAPDPPSSGTKLEAPPPYYSLADFLDYTPSERDQGNAGNCWAWAGTGVMEVAMTVATGVKDRLSVQYINSNYYHDGERTGCGGELEYFTSFYNGDPDYNTAAVKHIAVPWSNPGASYQDTIYNVCNDYSGTVVTTTPNYPILSSITPQTISTTGLTQSQAITNIKSALLNKQAVFFGFYLPVTGSYSNWYDFFDFWQDGSETTSIWAPNMADGQTWPDVGGHAVVCIGYDDYNQSWIMLNSWGTNANRPDGTFRLTQDLNYNCTFSCDEDINVTAFQWQTINAIFSNSIPSVTTGEASGVVTGRAFLNGSLTALGSSSPVNVSFEYGINESYGSTTPEQSMTAPGAFSAVLSGLAPYTTYHFRAKVVGAQTVYGSDMTFIGAQPVPGSSNLSLGLGILGLAAAMTFYLWRRKRPLQG